jgi:hypothetical protein
MDQTHSEIQPFNGWSYTCMAAMRSHFSRVGDLVERGQLEAASAALLDFEAIREELAGAEQHL